MLASADEQRRPIGPECAWRAPIAIEGWTPSTDEAVLTPAVSATEGARLVWVEACDPDAATAMQRAGEVVVALTRRGGPHRHTYAGAHACSAPRITVHVLVCAPH